MSNLRKITLAAMLASISIILTRFVSVVIPLGGFPSLSIDLGSVPILIGGIILGPIFGGIVGLVSDLIGFIINNRGGIFHFGFTLNAILTGVIAGLLYGKVKFKNKKIVVSLIIGAFVLFSLYYFNISRISDPIIVKITASILVTLLGLGFILFIQRIKDVKLISITTLVVIIELFVYILLTPIWIYQLYSLPIILSIASRFFRALILVPVKTTIVYQVLKLLKI